jgi:hypothetical protein
LDATGEDGRVVMQALYAAYASAGLGQKVQLPYAPTGKTPIHEWLSRKAR